MTHERIKRPVENDPPSPDFRKRLIIAMTTIDHLLSIDVNTIDRTISTELQNWQGAIIQYRAADVLPESVIRIAQKAAREYGRLGNILKDSVMSHSNFRKLLDQPEGKEWVYQLDTKERNLIIDTEKKVRTNIGYIRELLAKYANEIEIVRRRAFGI